MKKLTMARARQLIERELGIKAKELDMPDSYNGNPNFPWFQLEMGKQTITVIYAGGGNFSKGNELINLTVTHENSSAYVSEYFYSDTMEYCEACTEKAKYEVLCDRMGITETDAKLKRLSYEASDAVFRHYHYPARKVEQNLVLTVGTLLRINNNSAIYHTYQRFFDYNPSFQNQAAHFAFGELPETGTVFKYIGYGKHENGRDAIFVLQDIKTDHVYLYNAADCRKDVTILGSSDVTAKNDQSLIAAGNSPFTQKESELFSSRPNRVKGASFKLMIFDLSGKYFTSTSPFEESELKSWCKGVKADVLDLPHKAAGFTVYAWNRETGDWNAYSPDGKHSMTFDTGRRQDGVHESLHQDINFPVGPESKEIEDVEQKEMEEGPELEM